ncbi:hypothetical protein [Mangrovicoccus sp. HB161399]|uniref:hypothetical protein n=1 Tax=Mangrovicoccus sp. HB161399 TaxID=2720392 RepID=UPI001C131E83|nr:hypothetical protein [Mangrovicoccus sp. HB161399]
MTAIEDIRDGKSLRAWLEEQDSYETSVAIASRAALRVQPFLWRYLMPARRDAELTALKFVRSCLISSVAAKSPTEDIKRAAFAADAAAAAARAAFAADAAAAAARAAFAADAAAAAARAAAARAAFAAAAAAALWNEIRTDAGLLSQGADILASPLWTIGAPVFLSWEDIGRSWQAAGEPWATFAAWYEDLLSAAPSPDWPLLERIALIAPDQWEDKDGPDKIAAAIAAIRAEQSALAATIAATPNAEEIGLDPETSQPLSVPVQDLDDALLDTILRRLDRAMTRFSQACRDTRRSNMGPIIEEAVATDLAYLREDLLAEAGSPLGLFNALDDCLGAMRRCLEERGFSEDAPVQRLMGVIETCSIDVLRNSPATEEVVSKRREELFLRMDEERRIQFDQAAHDMAMSSMDGLKQKLLHDLKVANDPDAPPELRRRHRYNVISRTSRGARAVRERRYIDPATGSRVVEAADSIQKLDAGGKALWG